MDLVVFENNKPFVIDEFREGRFDYVELASDVAETKFFQFLFGQQIVDKLAQPYPSPRDRQHVPLWMYVCSQLSLRLHGQHSFHSYPLIIRAGGLVDALGPEVARRKVDPDSGNLSSNARASTTATSIPARHPATRTSSASWPATPSQRSSRNGTTVTSSPCTRNSGRSTTTACSSPMAPTCSCPTTRVTRARSGCSSTSTTIPSARNRNRR